MDKEALKKDVELIVSSIFSEKEDVDKKRLTEKALKDSAKVVTDLTTSITDKEDVIVDLETKVSEAEVTIAEHVATIDTEKIKVEELTKQLEEITVKLSASELKITDMEKDMSADARMVELKECKVISVDEKAQCTKIKEMTDEEFASYKKELVELRKSIETELASTTTVVKQDGDDAIVTTPSMKTDVSNSEQAALNVEADSLDTDSDYAELGKAMAAAWVEEK